VRLAAGAMTGGATAVDLLEAVAQQTEGGEDLSTALQALRDALSADRHAAVLCRHRGALQTVAAAWGACPGDATVAVPSAQVLLIYAALHVDALRRLGVASLCGEALGACGALRVLAPVARLWCRLGGPTVREVVALVARFDGEVEALRPLLAHVADKAKREELRELRGTEGWATLQVLARGELRVEAMRLLCGAAETIEVPACARGKSGEEQEAESDGDSDISEGGEDGAAGGEGGELATVAAPARARMRRRLGDLTAMGEAACTATDRRKAAVAALLETCGEEAAPAPHVSDQATHFEECRLPAPPLEEFLSHLAVDVQSAGNWPVIWPQIFPGPGFGGLHWSTDFEGGNLRRVRLESGGAFELLLCGDTNRSAHCQWFFFDVHASEPVELRLHIVNFVKPSSTWSDGQRAVALGPGDHAWRRAGQDYAYFPNRYAVGTKCRRRHYTLAFSLTLQVGRTRVAYFHPYLFGDFLRDLRCFRPVGDWLDVRDLGPTPGGRKLPLLTITDFGSGAAVGSRPHIVISSRVHPGEAPASFMMRGVLELLLSDSEEARGLRSRFVFVVLPMLNPDGVAVGNGRSNLSGQDLNRCWKHPPLGSEVAVVREVLEELCATPGGVLTLLDLHAHSARHGAFTLSNPATETLPDLLSEDPSGAFDRGQCVFSIADCKRGSLRCVAWTDFGVPHPHTVEATYSAMPGKLRLVTPQDLTALGRGLVRACALLPLAAEPVAPAPADFTERACDGAIAAPGGDAVGGSPALRRCGPGSPKPRTRSVRARPGGVSHSGNGGVVAGPRRRAPRGAGVSFEFVGPM